MPRFTHAVIPGALSAADHDAIAALAAQGFGAWRIARQLARNPSTVQGFIATNGLRPLRPRKLPCAYRLGGRTAHRFTRAEDRFIERLRLAGLGPTAIAAAATARFGTERSPSSIYQRLTRLAADAEA